MSKWEDKIWEVLKSPIKISTDRELQAHEINKIVRQLLTASQMEILGEMEQYMKVKKGSRIDLQAGNDLIIIPAEFIKSKQSQLKEETK